MVGLCFLVVPLSLGKPSNKMVSCSLVDVEYHTVASITSELKWFKTLLGSLGVDHPCAINLCCDSQFALHIAQNPVFHERTKHIEVDCHYVHEVVQNGIIATPSCFY